MANPNKNLTDPAYNSTLWNIPLNANFDNIDKGFGGTQIFNTSGQSGTYTLSNMYVGAWPANTASFLPLSWYFNGSPAGNLTFNIPSGVGGRWIVNIRFAVPNLIIINSLGGGGQPSVALSTGIFDVYSDGANVWYMGNSLPGDLKASVSTASQPGWFLAAGQSIPISGFPYLYSAIGTTYGGSGGNFTIPDLRGRIPAGLDNMGGASAGRLNGYTALGVAGGEQTHTLITGEMPSHNHTDSGHAHLDAGHNHPQTPHTHVDTGHTHADTGHSHGGVVVAGGPYGASAPPYSPVQTGGTTATGFASIATGHAAIAGSNAQIQTGYANIQNGFAAITNTGGSGPHNNVQPTIGVNWLIRY